jgi:hypothetical protein
VQKLKFKNLIVIIDQKLNNQSKVLRNFLDIHTVIYFEMDVMKL